MRIIFIALLLCGLPLHASALSVKISDTIPDGALETEGNFQYANFYSEVKHGSRGFHSQIKNGIYKILNGLETKYISDLDLEVIFIGTEGRAYSMQSALYGYDANMNITVHALCKVSNKGEVISYTRCSSVYHQDTGYERLRHSQEKIRNALVNDIVEKGFGFLRL